MTELTNRRFQSYSNYTQRETSGILCPLYSMCHPHFCMSWSAVRPVRGQPQYLCVWVGAPPAGAHLLEAWKHSPTLHHDLWLSCLQPDKNMLLKCDADCDISSPCSDSASFSTTSTWFHFRQVALQLPVSSQPAFRPETMLWWAQALRSVSETTHSLDHATGL